jgi:serine/threonine protein kinase
MSLSISDSNVSLPKTNSSETVAFVGARFTKEEYDLAFAVQAIRAGLLTERQLKSALANWTIHGEIALAEQLQTHGLVSPEDRERCEAAATASLNELHAKPAAQNVSSESAPRPGLQHVDGNGRLARVLGMADDQAPNQVELRSAVTRLTLVRKLGQGGFGTVWLARDENLQRYVALKEVTCTEGAGGPAVARFRREAEITGRLEHPGIVPVYESGEDQETERVFYTMRFLGKQTLHNAIQEYHERREAGEDDPMLLRNLLTAFVNVCQAIGHAHSRKVIHRDLKPENVAIDNFGQVIVIDWGLAKILDETRAEHTTSLRPQDGADSQTAAGQVFGTPLYMAPEQAAGRLDEVDERTDIYGLGAILFAILTGIAPHERSRPDAANSGFRGLITAIASKPTPLAREANPQVDPALEAICARAMAKRRYARYQTASELAEEIQRWMAGELVKAYRQTRSQQIGRWIKQHPRMSQAVATLLMLALVTAVVLVSTAYHSTVAARSARFDVLKGDAREIEVQFASTVDHLAKNVRFMSNVPPVPGIIAARAPQTDSKAESEETWRSRLELIYEGLLRANRDYLAVAYLSAQMGSVHDIVRVERQITDPMFIRRIPRSRLTERKGDPFFDEVLALNPGEVVLVIAESQADGAGPNRSRPHIVGAVPVYDEAKGNVFGLVQVETDLTAECARILERLGGRQAEIFITNQRGQVWVTSRPGHGVQSESATVNVATLVSYVTEFFQPDNVEPILFLPERGLIANRIPLNRFGSRSGLGVVLRLVD